MIIKNFTFRFSNRLLFIAAIAMASIVDASELEFASIAPIVQPGAPGQPIRILDAATAIAIADSSYSAADVTFMQGMIIHHNQALLMADLAAERTNNKAVLDLAGRIEVSQDDEMTFMTDWLVERTETAPDPDDQANHHMNHTMAGMASDEKMLDLSQSDGIAFDQLFLALMIKHHDGAVKMIKDLRKQSGAAYDPLMNEFVTDTENDQTIEIERMNVILVGLSTDPRAGLAAGMFNAEEAILNLQLIVSQRKPPGFFDPANPVALGSEDPEKENTDQSISAEELSTQ